MPILIIWWSHGWYEFYRVKPGELTFERTDVTQTIVVSESICQPRRRKSRPFLRRSSPYRLTQKGLFTRVRRRRLLLEHWVDCGSVLADSKISIHLSRYGRPGRRWMQLTVNSMAPSETHTLGCVFTRYLMVVTVHHRTHKTVLFSTTNPSIKAQPGRITFGPHYRAPKLFHTLNNKDYM